MEKETKKRAPRNRTLTLSQEETDRLERQIEDQLLTVGLSSKPAAELWDDKVICGDLLDWIEVIPDGWFDLIIIDPPYNLQKKFGTTQFARKKDADYEAYLRSWFGRVCDKLKPNGSLYMCGDWKSTSSMQRVIEERLTLLNRITWQREKGRGAAHNWKNGMEDIWFAVCDEKNYHFDVEQVKMRRKVLAPYHQDGKPKDWEETAEGRYRDTYPSNFWDDISIPFWSMPENTDHPTQKPEKLIAKLMLASSKPGDRVFDPFGGSGTTAVVAKKLGRHYCSIDINREYCLWTAKRLEMAEEDMSIQGYEDGVFWERNSKV